MASTQRPAGQVVTNPPGATLAWNTFFERLAGFLSGVTPLQAYTVAKLPSPAPAGRVVYVSNAAGGSVLAFSDGAAWRRVTDRAVVT